MASSAVAASPILCSCRSREGSSALVRTREINSWRFLARPSEFRLCARRNGFSGVVACLPPSSPGDVTVDSRKLYVSGLSFRTTAESLINAFEKFGRLVDVNLVMDRVANRPRGFAFLQYSTEEESQNAIEGMHGKFLDGRVIFVEVAKPRSMPAGKRSPLRSYYDFTGKKGRGGSERNF